MSRKFMLADSVPNGVYWTDRHNAAVASPKGVERGIVMLCESLWVMNREFVLQYGSTGDGEGYDHITEDSYARDYYIDLCRNAISLLSMDICRLDGGTLDKAIRSLCPGVEL